MSNECRSFATFASGRYAASVTIVFVCQAKWNTDKSPVSEYRQCRRVVTRLSARAWHNSQSQCIRPSKRLRIPIVITLTCCVGCIRPQMATTKATIINESCRHGIWGVTRPAHSGGRLFGRLLDSADRIGKTDPIVSRWLGLRNQVGLTAFGGASRGDTAKHWILCQENESLLHRWYDAKL